MPKVEKRLAVLRESSSRDVSDPDGKKRFIEIWAGHQLEASQEVTAVHGSFYTDDFLSSLSFSPSETRLLYSAEAKVDDAADEDIFEKYRFVPEFGEGYIGKKRPTMFIFQWSRGKEKSGPSIASLALPKTSLSGVPMFFSEGTFATEDKIFATSHEYSLDHRLLGIKFCPNRKAGIWAIRIPSSVGDNIITPLDSVQLTTLDRSCRSPRVLRYNDGKPIKLVWLSNAVGGPHASCSTLHGLDLSAQEERIIVDTVWDPKPNEFPGLYLNTLPTSLFLRLGESDAQVQDHVVLNSTWHSRETILLVRLADGEVRELTPDDDQHCTWNVLATDGTRQIVCSRSSPKIPNELVLGRLDKQGNVRWQIIAKPELSDEVLKKLAALDVSIIPIPSRYPTETIVIKSKASETDSFIPPCVTMPHGGPHSSNLTAFSAMHVALSLEGYTISLPNYTGSLGFGEAYVQKLLGRIGSLDVEDCIASVNRLIDLGIAKAGPGQHFLSGGSHGGFLGGHLIGQYPEVFSAAVLRNPVISLGEIANSDIPDWYYEEMGIPYTPSSLVTPEIYEKMYRMSPIAHVDAVRTPVLLLMGEKDRRVATTQGKNYFHALKGRGKTAEMLVLKDEGHGLEAVEALRVHHDATKTFFERYGQRSGNQQA